MTERKELKYNVPRMKLQVDRSNYNIVLHEWSYEQRERRITIWCSLPEVTSREKGLQYHVPYLKLQVDYKMMFLDWSYKQKEKITK